MFGSAQKRISSWDIGTDLIKILLLDGGQGSLKIAQSIEVKNSLGMVIPDESIHVEQMASLIASILKEYNLPTRDIRLSLPESAVSTQVIELPQLSQAELSSSIAWQAEQYLPIPNDELVTEYQVVYRPDPNVASQAHENMRILLIGTRHKVIDNLVAVFRNNGAEPVLMETQTTSLLRQFNLQAEDPNTLLVQIGASSMNVIATKAGEPVFVMSYPEAGELLTKAVANGFNLPKEQAEQYKQAYGLLPNEGEGKVLQALKPIMDLMVNNLKSSVSFFGSKTAQAAVRRIILTGGTAQLPGIVDFLHGALGMEVLVADNFSGFSGNLPEKNQAAYGVAMGLMKRQL